MRKAFWGERIREWFCAQENCAQNHFLSGTASNKQGVTVRRKPVNDTILIKISAYFGEFVDNRQFLCYNKPATWKKVFFYA